MIALVASTSRTREATDLWTPASAEHPELPRRVADFFSQYFQQSGRDLPWRNVSDPYSILIAEVMLQKTHSRAVPLVWKEFMRRWPTPEKLARAHLMSLQKVLRPLGLRKRVGRLRELGRAIRAMGRTVLRDFESLTSLPGVGRYTANAVLCQAYAQPLTMVDINAARVYCRLYGLSPKTLRQALAFADQAAAAAISFGRAREVNLGVFDFAQAICRVDPQCPTCPLLNFCEYGRSRVHTN